MKVHPRLVGLAVVLGATLGVTSTAEAACYGSTPAAVTFTDSALDGQLGLAPEITTVRGGLDAACGYSVVPGLTDLLISGDAVFVYIDRDGNPATGSPLFTGADVVVGTLGVTGPEAPPALGVWNGASFSFSDPTPVGAARLDGGFAASVDRLGVAPGVTTNVVVGTIYSGIYDNYIDMAPEPGMAPISLPVAYSTVAPPAPPVTTLQPVQKDTGVLPCVVPSVRGKTVGKARDRLYNANCDFAWKVRREYSSTVRKGRVIRTTPRVGSQTTKVVKLVVSKGRRKSARATTASLTALARLQELANAAANAEADR